MKSHCISLFYVSDVEKVGAKVFCLSYILLFASLTCDAVDQVRGNDMLGWTKVILTTHLRLSSLGWKVVTKMERSVVAVLEGGGGF